MSQDKYYQLNLTETRMELEKTPVVWYLPQVFSEELLNIPPEWKIAFEIHLQLGSTPISIPSYSILIVEMTKMKRQLEELLEQGFIR